MRKRFFSIIVCVVMLFTMRTGFRPRFTPFRRDFLNLFVKSIEYFIVSTV